MRVFNEVRQETVTDGIETPDSDGFAPTTWESDWIDIGGEG
jgi:hypothetical protein